jgi:multiple sugar transport system substrate-binding protein
MKRILFVAVLLVALTMVAIVPVQAQGETLEIYITGISEEVQNWFREVAFPAFQETHPDVTLEITTGDWGSFDASVAGWITTGSGPDLVYLGSEYAATFGPLLTDMDPYLADWEDLDQFLPSALETATYDGHLRGLPLLMSVRPIFYRTDIFAEGSEIPTTFGEALDFYTANSAVEDGAMTRMGFMDIGGQLFDSQEFIAYIQSAGGTLYNEDGTSAFDSAETAEALQYMYDRRRIILPTEDTAGLPAITGPAISSGSVVSGIWAMWQMPPLDDPIWENIAIAPYPAGEGENAHQIVQVFTDWLSVPSYVENPELAGEFLKFIGSQENALALSTVAGFTPVRTDAWAEIRANSPVWDTMLGLAEEFGVGFSDIRASAELRPLIVEQVTLFLTDQQSLEDTQLNLKDEYDAILEDGGYLD